MKTGMDMASAKTDPKSFPQELRIVMKVPSKKTEKGTVKTQEVILKQLCHLRETKYDPIMNEFNPISARIKQN